MYLLPIVKRAVTAPFPEDWSVGHDQMGEVYYFNKYSMKVITVHPMSDYFLDAIDDARRREKAERERADAAVSPAPQPTGAEQAEHVSVSMTCQVLSSL